MILNNRIQYSLDATKTLGFFHWDNDGYCGYIINYEPSRLGKMWECMRCRERMNKNEIMSMKLVIFNHG